MLTERLNSCDFGMLIHFCFKQSIPQEVIDTHELQSITLDYRRECQHDDIVDSLTTPEPIDGLSEDGENLSKFLHLLKSSGDGLEINRGRTEWRKKSQKR